MKMRAVIVMKVIGFVLILSATFVATVQLPRIAKRIDIIDSNVSDFKDARIMTTLCMLHYGEQFTRRRIELFEAHQMVARGGNEGMVQELRKRALDQTVDLAKQWAVLLSGDQKEQRAMNVEQQIDDIVQDNSRRMVHKIDEVERIWKAQQQMAGERNAKAHKAWHDAQEKRSAVEGIKRRWDVVFVWCQILGLIVLGVAEISDKFVKPNV